MNDFLAFIEMCMSKVLPNVANFQLSHSRDPTKTLVNFMLSKIPSLREPIAWQFERDFNIPQTSEFDSLHSSGARFTKKHCSQ